MRLGAARSMPVVHQVQPLAETTRRHNECGKSRSTALEPERPSVKKRRLREVRVMSALPQKVEHSAIHSITSSALASRVGGTVRPSAVTVFRLMTVSYSVGACTGRSASLSPLRMRSIKNVRPGLGGGPVAREPGLSVKTRVALAACVSPPMVCVDPCGRPVAGVGAPVLELRARGGEGM